MPKLQVSTLRPRGWKTTVRSHSQLHCRWSGKTRPGPLLSKPRSSLLPPTLLQQRGCELSPFTEAPEPSTEAGRAQGLEHGAPVSPPLWGCGVGAAPPGGAFPPRQSTPSGTKERWRDSPGLTQKDPVSPGFFFQHSLLGEIRIAESNAARPAAREGAAL